MPVSIKEKEIGEATYRFKPLPALTAGHVMRKLAPVYGAAVSSVQSLRKLGVVKFDEMLDTPGAVQAFWPLLDGFSKMDDKDVDFVINTCLDCVSRRVGDGNAWQDVRAKQGGGIIFADITLPTIYVLVGNVLVENFSSFFVELLGLLFGRDSTPTSS